MFVFNRPLGAVAAGIGFALLVVVFSGLCQGSPASGAAPAAARAITAGVHMPVTCVPPEACGIVRAGS
jgi:hypothetical protein